MRLLLARRRALAAALVVAGGAWLVAAGSEACVPRLELRRSEVRSLAESVVSSSIGADVSTTRTAMVERVARGGASSSSGSSPKTKKSKTTTKKKKKKKTATTKASSTTAKKKKKKRAAPEFDEDDEDEEDDDTFGYPGSSSKGRKKTKSSKYRAVESYYAPRAKPQRPWPTMWQKASVLAKQAAEQAVEKSKQAATKAKELGAEAAVRAQKAQRLAKAYYSSEYEKFLLTATWPSDQRVPQQLTRRLVESVARFPSRPASLPEDDPYRVTLRKLWKKMVEQDWRTSVKALYLLHALSRQAPTPKARALSRTLKSMLSDVDPKSGRKYFNRRDLVVKKVDEDRARLVDAYAGLVLRRALLFAGKFEDADKVSKSSPDKSRAPADAGSVVAATPASVKLAARRAQHALLVLEHAVQFLEVAKTGPDGKPVKPAAAHLVVVSCLDLVVADVRDAFDLAAKNVAFLVQLAVATDAPTPVDLPLSPTAAKDVHKAIEKFLELKPRLAKAAKAAVKTLKFFDVKASADLLPPPGAQLDPDTINDALAKWADRPALADDDDDDDLGDGDDDDDDDDDFDDDDDDDDDFDDDDDDF